MVILIDCSVFKKKYFFFLNLLNIIQNNMSYVESGIELYLYLNKMKILKIKMSFSFHADFPLCFISTRCGSIGVHL